MLDTKIKSQVCLSAIVERRSYLNVEVLDLRGVAAHFVKVNS